MSPNRVSIRRVLLLLGCGLPVAFSCLLLATPFFGLSKAFFYLVLGWVYFLFRVIPAITVSVPAVVSGLAFLLGFALGLHLFCRWLRAQMHPEAPAWPWRWTLSAVGLTVLAFVGGIAAVGTVHQVSWMVLSDGQLVERSVRSPIPGNESSAIGTLRAIQHAQKLFRSRDADLNDVEDYAGSLALLRSYDLIDDVAASGTKSGYRFRLAASPDRTGWEAAAVPAEPGVTGQRYFKVGDGGLLRWSNRPEGPYHTIE